MSFVGSSAIASAAFTQWRKVPLVWYGSGHEWLVATSKACTGMDREQKPVTVPLISGQFPLVRRKPCVLQP